MHISLLNVLMSFKQVVMHNVKQIEYSLCVKSAIQKYVPSLGIKEFDTFLQFWILEFKEAKLKMCSEKNQVAEMFKLNKKLYNVKCRDVNTVNKKKETIVLSFILNHYI